jgi:hypothetical protein
MALVLALGLVLSTATFAEDADSSRLSGQCGVPPELAITRYYERGSELIRDYYSTVGDSIWCDDAVRRFTALARSGYPQMFWNEITSLSSHDNLYFVAEFSSCHDYVAYRAYAILEERSKLYLVSGSSEGKSLKPGDKARAYQNGVKIEYELISTQQADEFLRHFDSVYQPPYEDTAPWIIPRPQAGEIYRGMSTNPTLCFLYRCRDGNSRLAFADDVCSSYYYDNWQDLKAGFDSVFCFSVTHYPQDHETVFSDSQNRDSKVQEATGPPLLGAGNIWKVSPDGKYALAMLPETTPPLSLSELTALSEKYADGIDWRIIDSLSPKGSREGCPTLWVGVFIS